LKRYAEANDIFEHEVPLPYINLARVYIDTQRYEDAIKTCQRALAVRSDYAKTYYTLGLAHLAAGDRESAIHDHRVLLTLTRDLAKKLYEAINK
jgi:tetratricopeptide (TPR) repeat protein